MTMPPNPAGDSIPDIYLVSHGRNGGLGSFATQQPCTLRRGDRVIVDSLRGREVGTVLCATNPRQARLLGATSSGAIVRPFAEADDQTLEQNRHMENRLFEASRQLARAQALPVEILDAEVLLEGRAILQFIGPEAPTLAVYAQELSRSLQLEILLENLALPQESPGTEEHGCGKPDCGKTAGGGCSTCGTGGGCSSCGTGHTDLRAYFGHLRTKMEANQRMPLPELKI